MFYISIVLLLVWPSYIVYKAGVLPGMTLDRIFLLVLGISFLINFLFKNNFIVRFKPYTKEIFLVISMFIWMLFSSFFADNTIKSVFASINWFLSGPFLMIYLIAFFKNDNDLKSVILVILFVLIIINSLGLIEMINKTPLFKNYLITETESTLLAGTEEKLRGGIYRIKSVFSNPLVYAQILVASIPLWLSALLSTKGLAKVFILINVIITYILLFKTDSRAGLALALAMPMLFFYISLYKRKRYFILKKIVNFILLPLLLILLSINIYMKFDDANQMHTLSMEGKIGQEEVSSLARILQIKMGLDVLERHPIVGQGQGEALRELEPLRSIDNYYLTIILSTGIVGFFLWLFFLLKIFQKGVKSIRYYNDPTVKYYTLSFLILLIYYTILSIDKGNNLLFILAGIILIRFKLSHSNQELKI